MEDGGYKANVVNRLDVLIWVASSKLIKIKEGKLQLPGYQDGY